MPEGARKERTVVTVVFADVVGFTAHAESLDPSVCATRYLEEPETLAGAS